MLATAKFEIKRITSPVEFRQKGATLAVALILLILVTLIAFYGAGGEVMDLRSAKNEIASREASAAAEFGAEQGAAYIRQNWSSLTPLVSPYRQETGSGWTSCAASGEAAKVPCSALTTVTNWYYRQIEANDGTGDLIQPAGVTGNRERFDLYVLGTGSTEPAPYKQVFILVAVGYTADPGSRVMLRQVVNSYPLSGRGVSAPLTVSGSVNLNGSIKIYGNPNGGGSGVPLSVWAREDVKDDGSPGGRGSYNTYYPNGDPLSSPDVENIDVLDVDSGRGKNPDSTFFPTDLFQYAFGVPSANYEVIKTQADLEGQVYANCNDLGPTSRGLIWVTGDCSPPTGDIGSAALPILLVVQGEMSLNGNGTIYGFIFSFCNAPGATGSCGIKRANGNRIVRGTVFADTTTNITSGSFELRFDPSVLSRLDEQPEGRGLVKVPSTWINF